MTINPCCACTPLPGADISDCYCAYHAALFILTARIRHAQDELERLIKEQARPSLILAARLVLSQEMQAQMQFFLQERAIA
jgi:hypothetical protein